MMRVLLASLLSGVVLLLLVEGALALFFPERTRYENPLAEPAYQFDDRTIIGLRPAVERKFHRAEENGGDSITWRVNSAGYRGNELRDDGRARIVVYGDSNIQARFSHLKDTYPAQLEMLLGKSHGGAVDVVNAGVIGFGPDQNLLRMERELPALQPELVILQVFADNDYGDLVRNRLFELQADGQLVPSAHRPSPDEWLEHDRSRRLMRFAQSLLSVRMVKRLLPESLRGGHHESSVSKRDLVAEQLSTREVEFKIYQRRSKRQVSHFADSYDIDIALDPAGDVARTKFKLMRGVLLKARELAQANNTRLMVLIQPSVVDMTDNNAQLGKSFLSSYPEYRPDTLSRTLEELCREVGVDVLNLYDEFAANSPESLYFRGNNDHWNDAGQALAAKATFRFIEEKHGAAFNSGVHSSRVTASKKSAFSPDG